VVWVGGDDALIDGAVGQVGAMPAGRQLARRRGKLATT